MKYKDITIEQALLLYNNNIELVCNGDTQDIICSDVVDAINNIIDIFNKISNVIIEAGRAVIETVINIYKSIREYILKIYDKKISKKKFIKLLQSYGVQRNDINKLIRNNKDRYTIQRVLLSIPLVYKKRSGMKFDTDCILLR